MLVVRYCNKLGQIVDQTVIESEAYEIYCEKVEEYGKADLIYVTVDNLEYCLL